MDSTYRRQFPNREAAMAYLEERGTLKYFGREGMRYEKCVYALTTHDRRVYTLFLSDDGLVEVLK